MNKGDPTGGIAFLFLEGYAEYYSVELGEKVTRGMTDNALKAMSNGGITPLGYYLDDEQHL